MFSTWRYAGISAGAFLFYLIMNICFTIYFKAKVIPDKDFTEWRTFHGKTSKAIMIVATLFSFKVYRLYYSHLYGHDNFKASFSNSDVFQRQWVLFTILNLVFSTVLIVAVDVVGVINIGWGN
jgi:hypothetical protein